MGAGIAEVFARNGLAVVAVEVDEAAVERGRGHVEDSTGRAVARGKLSRGRARAAARADHATPPTWTTWPTPTWSSRRCPSSSTSSARSSPSSTRSAARTRSSPRTPRRCRSPRSRCPPAVPARSSGCTSSTRRRCMKLVEVDPQRRHRAGRRRRRRGLRAAARQDRRHDRRPRRLHRQRPAVRLPQPRRVAVRVALRQPRGHRRGDEARLRAADGSARAARPDRARHRLRDPRHDVQAEPRPAARAAARSSSR